MSYNIKRTEKFSYGLIPPDFEFELQEGYSVLVGKNNSGKSTLLQFIFCSLFGIGGPLRDQICLIEQNRQYINDTTQPGSDKLIRYNADLNSSCVSFPKESSSLVGPNPNILHTLLLHRSDLVVQLQKLNEYLIRLDFNSITLKENQKVIVDEIAIVKHGSGIRCVLPILAALTSPDIKVIIIDEPESSLEARTQKALKELFLESIKEGKIIIVATQSHLFLNNEEPSKNYTVSKQNNNLSLDKINDKEGLLNLTYNLLGNSLKDLFFPNNFLLVEGSSDQVICEKVADLLNIPSTKVKIIAAKGVDNIPDAYKAIENTLVPLIAQRSPYSSKVVVMIDQPNTESVKRVDEIKKVLKDRCLVLNKNSIEEYIPQEIYLKSQRNKEDDLEKIKEIKEQIKHSKEKADGLKTLRKIKEEISSDIANYLEIEDLKHIPKIKEALEIAAEKAGN